MGPFRAWRMRDRGGGSRDPGSCALGGGGDHRGPEAARVMVPPPSYRPTHAPLHIKLPPDPGLSLHLTSATCEEKAGLLASRVKLPAWGAAALALVSLFIGGTLSPVCRLKQRPGSGSSLLRGSSPGTRLPQGSGKMSTLPFSPPSGPPPPLCQRSSPGRDQDGKGGLLRRSEIWP